MPTITKKFYASGVLTDPTSFVLSDPTGTFGVKRTDTDAVVVADSTAMVQVSTGIYSYTFTDPAYDLTYEYWTEIVNAGITRRDECTIEGASDPGSSGLWLTITEANAYFATRFNSSLYWTASIDKTAALVTAQAMLVNSDLFTFPDTATQAMKDAVCEQALFMIQSDPDIRLALQAQNVIRAGVVRESYYREEEIQVAVCAMAMGLLEDLKSAKPAYINHLDRTERTDIV